MMQLTYCLHSGIKAGASIIFAGVMTVALLLVMCSLIAMDPPPLKEVVYEKFDILMDKDTNIEEIKETLPEKPADPDTQPRIPEIRPSFENDVEIEVVMAPPVGPGEIEINNGQQSGTAMPIFRVAPQYPRRPLVRGIEGFVDLIFDITETGKTENIRVMHSQPQGYFEKAAATALSKWKYKPAIKDGVAFVQKNQATRMVFELEK